MKVDPDVTLIQNECAFLVAKATELFIESLARESFVHTAQAKKKTVQKRDVDLAIANVDALTFLEGAMNFWKPTNSQKYILKFYLYTHTKCKRAIKNLEIKWKKKKKKWVQN